MTPRETILLVDDDPTITAALSMMLECPGRTLIVCSDVEAAEVCLTTFPVNCVISDVQFSGEFGFEGLHFIDRVRRLAPNCRIVLMTGLATESLRRAAFHAGASAVLSKPFDLEVLETVLGADPVSQETAEVIHFPSIEDILRGELLEPAFQPIVSLDGQAATPFAFEALTRGKGAWFNCGVVALFNYSAQRSRLAELNLTALSRAIDVAPALPASSSLFINVDPTTFEGGGLTATVMSAADRAGIALSRIVLEITERSAFNESGAALRVFDELREAGIRFALDDHGSAYSHLAVINRIRPTFIKISATFGTAFEEDTTRQRIIRHIVNLANDFGCQTVLEGIESEATAEAARAAGVNYIQGFHLGRPEPAVHWVERYARLRAA